MKRLFRILIAWAKPKDCPYCHAPVVCHAGHWECTVCDGEGSY